MHEEWKCLSLFSPDSFDHTMKVADAIFKSGAFPLKEYPWLANPHMIAYVMQRGVDLGVAPFVALEEIRKLHGRWFISFNLAKGLVEKAGGTIKITKESSDGTTVIINRPGQDPHTESVSTSELAMAGVTDKDTYKRFPRQMARAVAIRRGISVIFADVLMGAQPLDFDVEKDCFTGETSEIAAESTTAVSAADVKAEDAKPKRTRGPNKPKETPSAEVPAHEEATMPDDCAPPPEEKPAEKPKEEKTGPLSPKNAIPPKGFIWDDAKGHFVPDPAYAKKKKEAEEPAEAKPAPLPEDWDLGDAAEVEIFDFSKAQHREVLIQAAKECNFDTATRATVQKGFGEYTKTHKIPLTVKDLMKGLKECASQPRK